MTPHSVLPPLLFPVNNMGPTNLSWANPHSSWELCGGEERVCLALHFIDPDPRKVKLENYPWFLVYNLRSSYTDLTFSVWSSPDKTKWWIWWHSWPLEKFLHILPSILGWLTRCLHPKGCWHHYLEPTPLPKVWDQIPPRTGDHLLHPWRWCCLLLKVSHREAEAEGKW